MNPNTPHNEQVRAYTRYFESKVIAPYSVHDIGRLLNISPLLISVILRPRSWLSRSDLCDTYPENTIGCLIDRFQNARLEKGDANSFLVHFDRLPINPVEADATTAQKVEVWDRTTEDDSRADFSQLSDILSASSQDTYHVFDNGCGANALYNDARLFGLWESIWKVTPEDRPDLREQLFRYVVRIKCGRFSEAGLSMKFLRVNVMTALLPVSIIAGLVSMSTWGIQNSFLPPGASIILLMASGYWFSQKIIGENFLSPPIGMKLLRTLTPVVFLTGMYAFLLTSIFLILSRWLPQFATNFGVLGLYLCGALGFVFAISQRFRDRSISKENARYVFNQGMLRFRDHKAAIANAE